MHVHRGFICLVLAIDVDDVPCRAIQISSLPLVDLGLPAATIVPRFVLLKRHVEFLVGEGPITGGASENEAADILDRWKATAAALQAMKPELSVFEPPEVSHLTMVQQMRGVPPGVGTISSTDKALAVLLAGHYSPGFTRSASSGCYLVYDASTNSLTAVPQIPTSPNFCNLGRGTAILSRGGGAYVVAEIGTSGSGCYPHGVLYLWQCTSPDQASQSRRWDRKSVRLPSEVMDPPFFIDTAFSYAGSCICWVDLLKGIMVCDLIKAAEEEPEFTFIPLPEGSVIDVGRKPRPRPEQFRTMSCVNGVIKFVALVGFYENNFACDNVMLRSWTLSPDLKEWTECDLMAVQDLRESKSFCERNLPKIPPMFPVLSVDEDEIVYLSLLEIKRKNVYDFCGQFEGVEVVKKAHHVLRVDVVQNKVIHCTKYTQGTLITTYWPTLLATEFTSYLHDHEVNQ